MSYLYTPSSSCGSNGVIPPYTCDPCPAYENGRIRSIAYIKTSYSFLDPTSTAEWNAAILSGDIVIIWQTKGTYDGGTVQELPGFGDSESINGGAVHTITYDDPNYKDNCDFYNAMRFASIWTAAYRTSSRIHLIGAPVTITPKNPVQDDLKSVVTWNVQLKWSSENSPCSYLTPDSIFDTCTVLAA